MPSLNYLPPLSWALTSELREQNDAGKEVIIDKRLVPGWSVQWRIKEACQACWEYQKHYQTRVHQKRNIVENDGVFNNQFFDNRGVQLWNKLSPLLEGEAPRRKSYFTFLSFSGDICFVHNKYIRFMSFRSWTSSHQLALKIAEYFIEFCCLMILFIIHCIKYNWIGSFI